VKGSRWGSKAAQGRVVRKWEHMSPSIRF